MTTNCNDARTPAGGSPDRDYVQATTTPQAIRRSIPKALKLLLVYVIGVPVLIGIVRVITHVIDPESGDDLLMGAIMWTSMVVCVLAPIGLAIYGGVGFAKWLVGKKSPKCRSRTCWLLVAGA
ncbi:hypothetical protein JQ629_34665 [Bradyrhizobium sp. AUGA SZCCT0222]|uniref:hypothetical protein n=1 Tax=Bradyrhizobium sp. AUGA SZCCT0222 TaxID=2807668 RepID=UPI001BABE9D1|nr:hypothetical protein [Bradyrhizobium sp. AUGA SZCCT0222]MBR1272633.1 hypothetical protein [Bradyrhizobium sp. AUGA SZCCT0222]